MRVFDSDPPGRDTNPSQLQVSFQQMLVLIYLLQKDEKLSQSLAEKKVTQIFQFRQSRGSNWGPCGRKAEILPTAPTIPELFDTF